MKKIIILILLAIVFLIIPQVSWTSEIQTSIIPEKTQWLIHVDMEKFLGTQIANLILKENISDIEDIKTELWKEIRLDPERDLAAITIFGMDDNEDNAVVCLQGNLNKKFLIAKMETEKDYKKLTYGNYTIHNWEKGEFGVFAKDNLVIISKREGNIKHILDVISGKKRGIRSGQLLSQLKRMPRTAFVKAVANNISELAGEEAEAMILKKAGMAFFMAMEKNGNLQMKLQLATDSEETAKNIDQMVKGLMAMARMAGDEAEIPGDLIDALEVVVQGKVVDLALSYPSEKFCDMMLGGCKDHKIGSKGKHKDK